MNNYISMGKKLQLKKKWHIDRDRFETNCIKLAFKSFTVVELMNECLTAQHSQTYRLLDGTER